MADTNIENSIESYVPTVQTIRKSIQNDETELSSNSQFVVSTSTASPGPNDTYDTNDINDTDDKRRTKIPVSRFRQTVERLTADRRTLEDKKEPHTTTRRSSIPKPTTAPAKPERKTIPKPKPKETITNPVAKLPATTNLEAKEPQEAKKPTTKPESDEPEDEFDKLYEEVAHSPVNIDVSLLNPKLEDSEVENKFEEIIHDYDDNKVQPIDVEKIRKSRIPFLKRQSLQDDRNSKIIAARDKVKINNSIKSEENDKNNKINVIMDEINENCNNGVKDKQFAVKHTITNITLSRSNGEDESTKVANTALVTEVEKNESCHKIEPVKGQIVVENIQKDFVKVGIPVFDSYVIEQTEKIEADKTDEVNSVLTYTTNNDDIEIDKTNIKKDILNNLIESNEIIDDNKPTTDNTTTQNGNSNGHHLNPEANGNGEQKTNDIIHINERDGLFNKPMLRHNGSPKNGHALHETINKEAIEIGIGNKLPKKESVMSKIAIFERQEPVNFKTPKKDSTLPRLITNNQTTNKVHVHTPLIVEEVYKIEPTTDLSENANKVENTKNGEEISKLVKAEMVIIESLEMVPYDTDSIQSTAKKTVTEEVLTPVLRKFEPNFDEYTNENGKTSNGKDLNKNPVVSKYIPVKEVLKRYESLSEINQNKRPTLLTKRSISERRINAKTDDAHTPLDTMFVYHEKPVSEILKDIYTPDIKDGNKKDNIFFPNIVNTTNKRVSATNPIESNSLNGVNGSSNGNGIIDTKANNIKEDKAKFKLYDFDEESKKPELEYKTIDSGDDKFKSLEFIQDYIKTKDNRRAKSVAELDLGEAVKGKVTNIIKRINSQDLLEDNYQSKVKDLPRKRSVSEKIALFERKLTPAKELPSPETKQEIEKVDDLTDDIQAKIEELTTAKKYGSVEVPVIELANGVEMPVLAVGTALVDPRLLYHLICAAIDLGYRAIDTAYIYGNEKIVGDAIRDKIKDGTVKREDLFIISKLWSTFHRTDLVQRACEASLQAMGLDYFDLYLIHNPMSFKEGDSPLPKIATVLQYSSHDYLDAWYGMESLGGRARALGLSNFNSQQIRRVLDRAKVKPVVNQVECHPYLTQLKLDNYCAERNITLSCFGVLGSKGTPVEYKSGGTAVIDEPLVQVMSSGLGVTPAQLLISYQIQRGHSVVVKASSAARLWENLQALTVHLTEGQLDALHALNRSKRTFAFKGMGETHKNYPFNVSF